MKNYLGLAESAGAQVHPLTTVTSLRAACRRPVGDRHRAHRRQAAQATQDLHRPPRDPRRRHLRHPEAAVQDARHRQAAEAVGQARRAHPHQLRVHRRRGPAARCPTTWTSPTAWRSRRRSIRRRDTHVEPCRYGKGSNAMGLLQTLMTDGAGPGGTDVPRWKQLFRNGQADPRGTLRLLNPRRWSERTMIALVMQHLDNSITTFTRKTKLGFRMLDSKQGHGEPNPTWIPVGQRGHPAHRREDRRRRRRHLGRTVQHPADRALPRRRGDRRQPPSTVSSTRISGCTTTRRCR